MEHGDDGALKLSTSPGGHGVWTAAKAKRARVACQQPLTILRYDCSWGLGGGVAQSQHLLLGMMEGCNPKQGQANKGTGAGDIMTKSARKVSIQADHYVLETALQMKLSHHLLVDSNTNNESAKRGDLSYKGTATRSPSQSLFVISPPGGIYIIKPEGQ